MSAGIHPSMTRRHRILSLSTEFPNPTERGKGLFVRSRLLAMAERCDLVVIAPVALVDYANPHNHRLAALSIPRSRREQAVDIRHPRWLYPPRGGWLNAFLLYLRLWPLARRLRATFAFEVIDAHYGHPEGIAAVLLGATLRVPVIITLRGSELRYRRQRVRFFWIRWALRRARRVIAVSDGLRALALDAGVPPHRVRTIPNGIDPTVFFPRDRTVARQAYGLAPHERLILCAGDLAELKGHHHVIRAVGALTDEGRPVRLFIAGGIGRSGRFASALRNLVATLHLEDAVRFLGEVPQAQLAELMCAADVFCLASSSEGWPNVVNEAMACGTPVVATDVGAVQQMITSPDYGAIVPVADGQTLIGALRAAVTRTWDRSAIARHGGSRSWNAVADEVLAEIDASVAFASDDQPTCA